MRQIPVDEAFAIIQDVYGAHGWEPNAASTREQRNDWLASAVACVHYGHAEFNPKGPDPRWCIKNAGGGRPQSDDIIVLSTTRAYWDLIPNAGADDWYWNLGAHSEPLPAGQNVYPPPQSALPDVAPTPDPGPGPDPVPEPEPPPVYDFSAQFALINSKLDRLLDGQNAAEHQQAADTKQIGEWMVEQAKGVVAAVDSVKTDLTPKIERECRLGGVSLRG